MALILVNNAYNLSGISKNPSFPFFVSEDIGKDSTSYRGCLKAKICSKASSLINTTEHTYINALSSLSLVEKYKPFIHNHI
ncbi:MAG: hypothetical protein DSM106950_33480 [Stigonema ocellatum SAG 48.90 = DSM 106950]|nr:hypothetical protein [Stigonema ocellatum SAG 48.90 = DSM 106950]